jgi:integrase
MPAISRASATPSAGWHRRRSPSPRGEWVEPTLSKITVGEWLPQWLARQIQLKPTTMVRYEVALRRQILPRWDFVPVAKITHSDVSNRVHSLADEDLALAMVRYAHRVLSLALTADVRDGRLLRNVAEGVPLPRVVGKPKRFLTHDQVQALAEACAPCGTLIKVLAYAGLRWGELVALTTRRVDLKRRRIEVVEAITEVHGRVIVGTTKTPTDKPAIHGPDGEVRVNGQLSFVAWFALDSKGRGKDLFERA